MQEDRIDIAREHGSGIVRILRIRHTGTNFIRITCLEVGNAVEEHGTGSVDDEQVKYVERFILVTRGDEMISGLVVSLKLELVFVRSQ